jgi:hypothetical protein
MANRETDLVQFRKNYCVLKKYTDDYFKFTMIHGAIGGKRSKQAAERGSANDQKLDNNKSRARSAIFEIAICNRWDWWITLTLDPKKYDRSNLAAFIRDYTKFEWNYSRDHKTKIKHHLIPELHEDGAWHMHGFITGLPRDQLFINENGFLDWQAYKDKFGFISMDRVRNAEAASKYLTKYITKDLDECVKTINAKMYYSSQGLKRAEIVKSGMFVGNKPLDWWNYDGEWASIKDIKHDPVTVQNITNKIICPNNRTVNEDEGGASEA